MSTKSAFVSIIGVPNVGKSSILNTVLGEKIAITSSKPQTTRTRIMGVLTDNDVQLVFTDTPGYFKPKNKLGQQMVAAVGESLSAGDVCLFVTESKGKLKPGEEELLAKLAARKARVILAVNKIDMLEDKSELLQRIALFASLYDFEAVVPVSATTGENIGELVSELKKLAEEGPFYFPEDTLTDQPEKVIAAEIIREKMLRLLSKEVPHGVAVSIETMRERPSGDIMDIDAVIYCERESHKGIIIGKHGAMLKKISTYARQDLEKFFMIKVNLSTWVKVKEDWRNRPGLIHNFGLDFTAE